MLSNIGENCNHPLLSLGPLCPLFVRRAGCSWLTPSRLAVPLWMGRFSLVLCFFLASAGQIDEYLLQRGWSENYVRSFMEAIFPVDTWTSLNQLMSDNDQFFTDLAE